MNLSYKMIISLPTICASLILYLFSSVNPSYALTTYGEAYQYQDYDGKRPYSSRIIAHVNMLFKLGSNLPLSIVRSFEILNDKVKLEACAEGLPGFFTGTTNKQCDTYYVSSRRFDTTHLSYLIFDMADDYPYQTFELKYKNEKETTIVAVAFAEKNRQGLQIPLYEGPNRVPTEIGDIKSVQLINDDYTYTYTNTNGYTTPEICRSYGNVRYGHNNSEERKYKIRSVTIQRKSSEDSC